MKKSMKPFRRLKRLELVELIYQIRKDNVRLEKQVASLKEKLAAAEEQLAEADAVIMEAARQPGGDLSERMDAMMDQLQEVQTALRAAGISASGKNAGEQ